MVNHKCSSLNAPSRMRSQKSPEDASFCQHLSGVQHDATITDDGEYFTSVFSIFCLMLMRMWQHRFI